MTGRPLNPLGFVALLVTGALAAAVVLQSTAASLVALVALAVVMMAAFAYSPPPMKTPNPDRTSSVRAVLKRQLRSYEDRLLITHPRSSQTASLMEKVRATREAIEAAPPDTFAATDTPDGDHLLDTL